MAFHSKFDDHQCNFGMAFLPEKPRVETGVDPRNDDLVHTVRCVRLRHAIWDHQHARVTNYPHSLYPSQTEEPVGNTVYQCLRSSE